MQCISGKPTKLAHDLWCPHTVHIENLPEGPGQINRPGGSGQSTRLPSMLFVVLRQRRALGA